MLENVLQDGYYGILISDGYRVYRAWLNRLRCWPHLIRKLRGLAESSDGRVSGVGQEMEGLMHTLKDAIYAARIDPPPEGLPFLYATHVDRLKSLCTAHWSDAHPALRSVAVIAWRSGMSCGVAKRSSRRGTSRSVRMPSGRSPSLTIR